MASVTKASTLGASPSKIQDGPYQIELEDIESDETTTTGTTSGNTTTGSTTNLHKGHTSTSPMKPENHFTTGFTTGAEKEVEPPSRSSTYLVRACVCAFAILLLWITSLNLAKVFVVSVIRSPDTQTVVTKWDNLADVTVTKKDAYSQCGINQNIYCNHSLYSNTDTMLSNIARASAINAVTLQTAGLVSQACSSLTVELSQSIKKWKDLHPYQDIQYNLSCSDADIANVKTWVDRPDLIHNQAYVLAGAYSKAVDSRSQRMLGYASNFTDYNIQYIKMKLGLTNVTLGRLGGLLPSFSDTFANITLGVLAPAGRLVDCMSMATSAAQACPGGARAAWDSQSAAVKDNYNALYSKLASTTALYTSTTSALGNIINGVRTFFNKFLQPAASSLSTIGIDLGGFPSLNFGIPPAPTIGSTVPWLDPSFTFNSTYFDSFKASVAASAASSRAAAAAWYANQTGIVTPLNGMFSDYNPPPLMDEMNGEAQAQQSESIDYRTQTAFALNQQPQAEAQNATVTLVKGFLSQQVKSLSPTNFKFEPLSGNLLLAPLLDVIPNLYILALAIDYVWRGYRSVRLIIKYWFQSAVGLPVIDVRDYENHAGATGPVKAVAVITHPCTIVGVLLLLFTLALISIVPPYTSIVHAYEEGCVQSNDGTVLTNNTFSVAYNYATSDGNKIITEGYQQYDASRNEICGRHLQASTDAADSDSTNLAAAVSAQQTNADQTDTIYRCINFTIFGPVNGYNATYGARHPLVIVDDAIDRFNKSDHLHPCMPLTMSMYSLLPAVFNCTDLLPCPITCEVEKKPIADASWQAGCYTEYLVHSFIARFGITILVFISLNLSRMLFMAAIVRLGWRSLTPRGFEFVSNCTRIGETSKTINAQLVTQLNKAIASYERFAIFLFGLAILVHIPYIVVLSTVNSQLAYHT